MPGTCRHTLHITERWDVRKEVKNEVAVLNLVGDAKPRLLYLPRLPQDAGESPGLPLNVRNLWKAVGVSVEEMEF